MRTRFSSGIKFWSLGLAFCAPMIVLVGGSLAVETDDLGKPLPLGTNDAAGLSQEAAQEYPDISNTVLPSGSRARIAETLTSASAARKPVLTRGKKEVALYQQSAPSVVFIVTENGVGSGSYLGSNTILTNWHVVQDAKELGILFKPAAEGEELDPASVVMGKIIKTDPVSDLALVKVPQVPSYVRPLTLAPLQEIQVGLDVHAIGHPAAAAWTYTKGVISQVRRNFEWGEYPHHAHVIQTQTPINPGSSGGPLLDDVGRLIGVNTFKAKEAENLNFAISVEQVSDFLKSKAQTAAVSTAPPRSCEARRLFEGRDESNRSGLINLDTNCDGVVDMSLYIPDQKSEPTKLLIDSNADSDADIVVMDTDRDGKWDTSLHDVDFDDKTDLIGYHPDGELQPSSYEKYAQR